MNQALLSLQILRTLNRLGESTLPAIRADIAREWDKEHPKSWWRRRWPFLDALFERPFLGSLYAPMDILEKEGWVISRWRDPQFGESHRRRLYRLQS